MCFCISFSIQASIMEKRNVISSYCNLFQKSFCVYVLNNLFCAQRDPSNNFYNNRKRDKCSFKLRFVANFSLLLLALNRMLLTSIFVKELPFDMTSFYPQQIEHRIPFSHF